MLIIGRMEFVPNVVKFVNMIGKMEHYSPCEDMNGDNVCDICGSMLYFEPGMGECGCGCYMPGCTCGSECPICGNTGMMSSDTVVEEFNDGDSDSDVFTSGDEGKSDFKDDLG